MSPLVPPAVAEQIRRLRRRRVVTKTLITELPDAYEIVRAVRTETGYGTGATASAVAETGHCLLEVRDIRPGEGRAVEQLGPNVAYVVTLPVATTLTAADRIRVGGRLFTVSGVARGGTSEAFVTATLEEAT